jgi:hypothetical protein
LTEDIINNASCLSLLSNAVLVWNTVRMGEIVARLRAAGETVSDENLARISPLAYAHVIPNGIYVFDRTQRRGTVSHDMLPVPAVAPGPSSPETIRCTSGKGGG